jgi:hypothetical protein
MFKCKVLKRLDAMLARIDSLFALLTSFSEKTMKELDDLTVQVKANTDAEASAVTLLGQLSDLIKAAGTDPAKLAALTSSLDSSKQALAAAILANTPAGPPATP